MNPGHVDSPGALPWIGVVMTLPAGAMGWLSLLVPGLWPFALLLTVIAVGTALATTVMVTDARHLWQRRVLAAVGFAAVMTLVSTADPVTRHILFGLGLTTYLVLLSAGSPWGTSPIFLLLVAVAAAGAAAGTLPPPSPVRGLVAWRTLLYALPTGLLLGLLTGLVNRRR